MNDGLFISPKNRIFFYRSMNVPTTANLSNILNAQ